VIDSITNAIRWWNLAYRKDSLTFSKNKNKKKKKQKQTNKRPPAHPQASFITDTSTMEVSASM
jgi:hypothetical protein